MDQFKQLFPNKRSVIIFVGYIALFVNQGVLVSASQKSGNTYAYNTTAVVLMTELLKLVISVGLYVKDEPFGKLIDEVVAGRRTLMLYLIPAGLYCTYNNLAFVNLAAFDPTSYFLLLQIRVVITGILYQILFRRKLSAFQWGALILLTIGCAIKQLGLRTSSGPVTADHFFNTSLVLILVQVFCSCFAGVYNEYLLKGNNVHIMVQNVYMYLDSILCNVAVLLLTDSPNAEPVTEGSSMAIFFSALMQPVVLCLILNNALCGIVTSLFLKTFNAGSILKSFASALELVFTAIVCLILFRIPVDGYTALSIAIVSLSVYIYSKQPVGSSKTTYSLVPDEDKKSKDDNVV